MKYEEAHFSLFDVSGFACCVGCLCFVTCMNTTRFLNNDLSAVFRDSGGKKVCLKTPNYLGFQVGKIKIHMTFIIIL